VEEILVDPKRIAYEGGFVKNQRRSILGIAILTVSAATYAADCSSLPKQDASEATIKELEKQWSQAYSTGDTAFLECLYGSNFRNVDSKGVLTDRAGDISSAVKNVGKSWTYDPTKYHTSIFMHLHTAVATFLRADSEHGYRGTDIYEYDGKRWHAIFSQSTKF
jgi:uncharacterized protein DUF4440